MSNTKNDTKKPTVTPADAARIQSHADRTNSNQGFKARVQSAADKAANAEKRSGGKE